MKRKLIVILSGILTLILYIFLHESGHCIVALACGARIVEFSILTAHMASVGGRFTYWSALWHHANGLLFPLILSYVHMVFYQKKNTNQLYRIFSYFWAIISFFSIFPWFLIPIFYLCGYAPAGDDCTKFLIIFSLKYHPIFVSIGAVILMSISLLLMNKKHIITNFLNLMRET